MAREFLSLIDKCFPPSHPLSKIFNRKTVKVSYSTTPNMAKIIAGQNAKVLREKENQKKECNCTKNKTCPLDKKCQTKNLIYQATVKKPNNEKSFYIGLTSTDFKKRLGVHHQSFRDPEVNQTSLSKHIWKLRSQGIEPEVTWKLIDRGKPYSPDHNVSQLCIKERFYIIFRPEMATINSRKEIFNSCIHKKSALLIKIERKSRKKKKSPGN